MSPGYRRDSSVYSPGVAPGQRRVCAGRFRYPCVDRNGGAYFTHDLTHDLSGNVASEKYCLPSNCTFTQGVTAAYDYHGNVVSLTYPDGRSVYRSYDLLDRLTQTGESNFLAGASRAAAVPLFTRPRPYFSGAVYYPAAS